MNPTPTLHAVEQAKAKGFTAEQTWLAVTDPDVTYPSRKAGQERRINVEAGVVAIVETATNRVITFYENIVETDLRPDQIARGERIAS